MLNALKLTKINTFLLIIFILLSIFLYYPSLNTFFYGDDYCHIKNLNLSFENLLGYFIGKNTIFLRPFESIYLHIVQHFYGLETWPVQLFNTVIHGISAWLIFIVAKKWLKIKPISAFISGMFYVSSGIAVMAIVSNDTTSQVLSGFFGILFFFQLIVFYENKRILSYILLGVIFILAMLSKETSAGLIVIAFIFSFTHTDNKCIKTRLISSIKFTLPLLILLTIYLLYRNSVVETKILIGESRYSISFGLNSVKSLIIYIISSYTIIPSTFLIKLWYIKKYSYFYTAIIGTLILYLYSGFILFKNQSVKQGLIILSLSIGTGFPVILLGHISELYAYNALPFVAIYWGYIFSLVIKYPVSLKINFVKYFFIIILLAINILSALEKEMLMKYNGDRSKVFYYQIMKAIEKIPPNGNLEILSSAHQIFSYSVFYVSDIDLIKGCGVNKILREGKNDKLLVKFIDEDNEACLKKDNCYLVDISRNN